MEQPAHDLFDSSDEDDESLVEDDDEDEAEALQEVWDLRDKISSRCGSWHENWGPEKLEGELKKLAVSSFWCPRRQQYFWGKRIAPITYDLIERFEPVDLSRDLVDAAESGNLGIVERWLDGGGDVNGRDRYGYTLLMHAAQYGRTDLVRYLLSRGAAANETSRDGNTALHWACDETTLYATSSSIPLLGPWVDVPIRAPGSGPDIVKMLLDAGVSVHARNDNNSTPLSRFLYNGRSPKIALMLLRAGAMLDLIDRSAEDSMREREERNRPTSSTGSTSEDASYPYIKKRVDESFLRRQRQREPPHRSFLRRLARRGSSTSSDESSEADELPRTVRRLNSYAKYLPRVSWSEADELPRTVQDLNSYERDLLQSGRIRSLRVYDYDEDWKTVKALVRLVRRAGGWKRLCRLPHKEVSRLASLVARGHAEPTPETKMVYIRLFRLPAGPLLKVLSFWQAPE